MSIKTLGDLIRIKRYERRFSRWQLALKMGIAVATVRAWERGTRRPDESQMAQLVDIFECGVQFAPLG